MRNAEDEPISAEDRRQIHAMMVGLLLQQQRTAEAINNLAKIIQKLDDTLEHHPGVRRERTMDAYKAFLKENPRV